MSPDTSVLTGRRTLYPPIEPYRSGWLRVSDLHEIYYEEAGHPDGIPAVFVHGGPGTGADTRARQFFDPQLYRIVVFDQRGAGRSRPHASLEDNTTSALIADLERLRQHLQIDQWLLFGGSWGSLLAIAYAQSHPQRARAIVLRGIFLGREHEIRWFNQWGASEVFPEPWAVYLKAIPEAERDDLVAAYYRRLTSPDPDVVMSTLHTDDAFGAVVRLLDLGIDRSLISASLSLVVAQRLARKVCQQCKEPYTPSSEVMQKLRIEDPEVEFYRGKGCPACRKMGYSGRAGIYEMLRVTSTIKELIRLKSSENILRRAATVAGTKTLLEDGISKACSGVTNPDELARVIEVIAEETFPCPKCASMVSLEFKSCPFCAFTLRNTCHACGQELNAKWTVCPYCSTAVGGPAGMDPGAKAASPTPRLLSSSNVSTEAHQPSHNSPESTVAETKCPRIVIADDDENILKIVTATLRQLPMTVDVSTAADGLQALELIQSKGADLAILDLKMPGLDGFQVCERLRQDIRTAFLPILMLTANSDQENRTKGFLIGTDDFMAKPFDVTEFLARVTRLLRRTYGV